MRNYLVKAYRKETTISNTYGAVTSLDSTVSVVVSVVAML